MVSAMRVGRLLNSAANQRKSSRKSWTFALSRRHVPCSNGSWNAVCRVLNKPRAPGMAKTMERSSPMTWCQCLVATRRVVQGREARMAWRRAKRRGGR